MVSTRRSRSQTAQTEDCADVGQGSQQEVSSGKNSGKDNASDGQRAPGQLQPIAEEPAAAAAAAAAAAEPDAAAEQQDGHEELEQQRTVAKTRQSQQRARPSQQQQQQLAQPQQPAAVHVVAPAAAAAASGEDEDSETEAAVAADADDEDDWDFDGPDMLQNLAASIRSALGASEPTGQRLHAAAAAAAGSDSDAEDMELDNLRWRPQTGLQLPARAARVVAAAAAGNQQQRELTAAGPQVHNPAVAAAADDDDLQDMSAAAAAAPPPEGPSVAAATKPKGLAKQLPAGAAAAAAGKQQGGKTGSRKGAAAAAAGAEGADRKWYQLPAVEITDEVKRDLRLLRLRGAYDPKRFYKSFDETKFPKHFAIGTVVDDALDFYGGRLSAGQRKATLTEQLLADTELQHTRKKRYGKLQEDAQKWVKHKKRKTSQPRKTPSKHRPKH